MAVAAGTASAQPCETLLDAADAIESDVGLGLLGSRDVQARVVTAWAALRRFGAEQQQLPTNTQDFGGMTLLNSDEVVGFTPRFVPPAANGLWRLKQFGVWHKDLSEQER